MSGWWEKQIKRADQLAPNANGSKELLEIKIDPEAVKGGDTEMLQDLIIAAVNEAARKADEAMNGKLGSKIGGLGLPGGLI